MDSLDLVSGMSEEEIFRAEVAQGSINPNDGKYRSSALEDYLSERGEWKAFAEVQMALMESRHKFGLATEEDVVDTFYALREFGPLNGALIEKQVTKHDQLGVIEELGRHMPEKVKALLHPGTTSYDIVDTARNWLFKRAWNEVMRPNAVEVVKNLCKISQDLEGVIQVGRTHLQRTSPVPFETTFASYAARIAERVEKCDRAFGDLRGKISGIVGTGASVEMVIGQGRGMDFERDVLERLGLKADYTASQIVQKERLADVGHQIVTLGLVLGDFANDMRLLYSTDINEVTSREGKERLGGSSADAGKNNPINWENISGKMQGVTKFGILTLYEMIATDLQRDLRGSVQARYQPQGIMAEVFESLSRCKRGLETLSVNSDKVAENLSSVAQKPSEAMTAILRGTRYIHPQIGVGHEVVKEFSKRAQREERGLLEVALEDSHFADHFNKMGAPQQEILKGGIERYIGSAIQRARINREYAMEVASRSFS